MFTIYIRTCCIKLCQSLKAFSMFHFEYLFYASTNDLTCFFYHARMYYVCIVTTVTFDVSHCNNVILSLIKCCFTSCVFCKQIFLSFQEYSKNNAKNIKRIPQIKCQTVLQNCLFHFVSHNVTKSHLKFIMSHWITAFKKIFMQDIAYFLSRIY